MPINMAQELATLEGLATGDLVARYAEVYGEPARTRHRLSLIRKIAWRLQAQAEGDLSERARQRAAELADDTAIRARPPRTMAPDPATPAPAVAAIPISIDPRLPAPGTTLTRAYKGRMHQVTVIPSGFEYQGTRYKTLTAVAKAITGQHLNGYQFFRLGGHA